MKINLTNKQYRLLLDLVYTGAWLINAHRDEALKEYEEVESYVYSFAKQFGLDNLVEYVREKDTYYPTREFEEGQVNDFVDEYDDDTFWSELQYRLADRDVDQDGPIVPEAGRSAEDTRFMRIMERESQYEQEFIDHGLDHVKVKLSTPPAKE